MVPSARNVEITARPCSFAPSWAASSRVVMCSPFVPCLRLKGSSFWLTIRKGHDLIAVLTTGSLRSYCPVSDPQTKIQSAPARTEDPGQHVSVDRSAIGTADVRQNTTAHAEKRT